MLELISKPKCHPMPGLENGLPTDAAMGLSNQPTMYVSGCINEPHAAAVEGYRRLAQGYE